MNKKLEEKLFNDYKELFRDKWDRTKSVMDEGFRCGDGWFDLVRCRCDEIYCLVDDNPGISYPRVYSVERSFRFF